MPGKGHFTKKQDRQVKDIVRSEIAKGKTPGEATKIAYGHVQEQKKKGGK